MSVGLYGGMSKEEVKKTENREIAPQNEDDTLVYKTKLGPLDAGLIYMFIDDRLFSVGYVFVEKHTNENAFIDDFETIQKALTGKYGFDNEDNDWVWKNDLYTDDLDKHGFALSMGHVERNVIWRTLRTIISHEISGDNFEIKHRLRYVSVEYAPKYYEQNKKSIEDDI